MLLNILIIYIFSSTSRKKFKIKYHTSAPLIFVKNKLILRKDMWSNVKKKLIK